MTNLPPHFVEVLANRLAEYTGRDARALRPARSAGDSLADRMADEMLDDVRRHVGDEHPEYLSARRRFVEAVGPELRTVSVGVGTDVQRLQQSRADAERVFAVAVDVADPIGVSVGAPRALEAQRAARITVARGLLHGLPENRIPTSQTVGEWLTVAEGDRQEFVKRAGEALLRAAGDSNREPRTSIREPNETLRDGVARAWVRQRLPEVAAALGRPLEPGDIEQLRYDIQGGMADGLAQAISERSGTSSEEVLDRLCGASDRSAPRGAEQWPTARHLLVPDAALESVAEEDRHLAGWRTVYAMQDEFKRQYGSSDWMPDLTPEEVGAAIAEAGARTAERFGATLPVPAQRDEALDAAVNAAFVPGVGQTSGAGRAPGAGAASAGGQALAGGAGSAVDQSSAAAGQGTRSAAPRPGQQRGPQIPGR